MAALQLLPRELLSLLARPTSSYSSLHAGSWRASSYARQNLDILLLLQWPRYRHNSSFDPALAREFDRPEAGFDFPGEKGAIRANFMEEEGDEYAKVSATACSPLTATPSSNKSNTAASTESAANTHARHSQIHACVMKLPEIRKLQTPEEILDMLAWLEHAPSLSSLITASSSGNDHSRYNVVIRHVARKLVTLFPGDIDILTRYAMLAARKGFAVKIPVDFFAHISRFSSYERLQPFLSNFAFAQRSRDTARRLTQAAKEREQHLRFVGNAIIRAQVLAARHVDAVNLVHEVRRLGLSASANRQDGAARAMPIEPFTYKLLSEELSRSGVHPRLLKEIYLLQRQDYPAEHLPQSQPKSMEPADDATDLSEGGRNTVIPSSQPLSRKLAVVNDKPKLAYLRLRREIASGNLPTKEELSAFRQLCNSSDGAYLFKSLFHSLQVSESELEAFHLRTEMQQGRIPTTEELAKFIDGCVAAKRPEIARDLGQWMEQQTPRFQSLWRVTRMYRLVESGKVHNARLALRIFMESFMMLGVPEQVKEGAERASTTPHLVDDIAPAKPKELLWPSTHSITIAIRALFIQDKTPAYIKATYRSFVETSYSTGQATLPLSSLPDQVSYDAFLQPLVKVGEADMAFDIMHDMRNRGLMPNRHNWDTLIGGYATYGRLDMVEAILSRMERQVRLQQAQRSEEKALPQEVTGITPFFTQTPVDVTAVQKKSANGLVIQKDVHTSQAESVGTSMTQDEPSAQHLLDVFEMPTPSIVTYTTVIRGLGIARETVAATEYRSRLFKATNVAGARLYRAGQNTRTNQALEIIASMKTFSAQRQRSLEMQAA